MKYNFDEIINRENSNCFKYDKREMIFGTQDVLPMWIADMDFRAPAYITDALKERLDHGVFGYSFYPDSTTHAMIDWTNRRHGWTINAKEVLYCPSVVPAINIIVTTLTEPGDEIIVQSPVYFPFFTAITDHHRVLINNRLLYQNNRYSMDYDGLRKAITPKTKMLILCNPHNPGGRVWSSDELKELISICKEHNIIILSDEIHCDIVYKSFKHNPLMKVAGDYQHRIITLLSPNKAFNLAALFASAIIVSDSKMRQQIREFIDKYHIGWGNVLSTIAFELSYSKGDEWIDQLMDYLGANLNFAVEYIRKNIPSIVPVIPESTYLLWLDCSQLKMNNHDLREFMIKKARLGLNDGPTFGAGGEGFQRMNIACPRSVLLEGLQRLALAVNEGNR